MEGARIVPALALLVSGCAVVATAGKETPVAAAGPRPGWLTRVPDDTARLIFVVGRARAVTESGALTDAREGCYRQLVDSHYGTTIKKDYSSLRTELERRIMDRLRSTSTGEVAGAREREVHWERWQTEHEGRVHYFYRAYVLLEVDRARLDRSVRRWIETSPPVVSARALAAEIHRRRQEQQRSLRDGTQAARERDLPAASGHYWRAEQLQQEIEQRAARYHGLLGRPPPGEAGRRRDPVAPLRSLMSELARGLRIARVIVGGAAPRRVAVGEVVGEVLTRAGLKAAAGGCRAGATHQLTVEVGEPSCRQPGMGVSCDLRFDVTLAACGGRRPLTRGRIEGKQTRGAALSRAEAISRAWQNLGSQGRFGCELARLLSAHVPLLYRPGCG